MTLPRPSPTIDRKVLGSHKVDLRTTYRLYEWEDDQGNLFYTVTSYNPVTKTDSNEEYHSKDFPSAHKDWRTRKEDHSK